MFKLLNFFLLGNLLSFFTAARANLSTRCQNSKQDKLLINLNIFCFVLNILKLFLCCLTPTHTQNKKFKANIWLRQHASIHNGCVDHL